MNTDRGSTERGQAVVLIALAIVALLGFTALAVDGSMIFSDRRYAQSAADAAALAGGTRAGDLIAQNYLTTASWSCNSAAVNALRNAAESVAISQAATNNIALDTDMSDQHGVDAVCVDSAIDKYLDVIVTITEQTETAFAHFVSQGPIANTVTAVVRVYPRKSLAFGYTIVALNPAGCSGNSNGAKFHGNPDVLVCGGGIFSNGCLRGVGNIDVDVKDFACAPVTEGIYYATELEGGGSFQPNPSSAPHIPLDAYALDFTPEELCARPGANKVKADKLPTTLSPGLWCITGDVKLSGKKDGDLFGHGVTLVFLDGGLSCNGNCDMRLTAPASSPDPYPAVPGLLIYSLADTDKKALTWKLNGNNDAYFKGTILVPKASVEMLGTGNEESFMTQVIAWNFEGGGTNDSTYKWNDNILYSEPVRLDFWR